MLSASVSLFVLTTTLTMACSPSSARTNDAVTMVEKLDIVEMKSLTMSYESAAKEMLTNMEHAQSLDPLPQCGDALLKFRSTSFTIAQLSMRRFSKEGLKTSEWRALSALILTQVVRYNRCQHHNSVQSSPSMTTFFRYIKHLIRSARHKLVGHPASEIRAPTLRK